MAGRHHVPPHSLGRREREAQLREREAHFRERGVPLSRSSQPHHPVLIEDPRRPLPGNHLPFAASDSRQHPALIGERIDAQHREIQALLLDNQRLAATHVALKQELAAAQQELRHLSAAAVEVKAETDAQVREVYEQSLKMEAEVRSIDALKGELNQVKADIQKLDASRQELVADLKTIDGDLTLAHSELQHLPAIEKEIENMHRELKKGRYIAIHCYCLFLDVILYYLFLIFIVMKSKMNETIFSSIHGLHFTNVNSSIRIDVMLD